jgi:hypothetical protein
MSEEEELLLKDLVEAGLNVLWQPDSETARKVVSVTERKFKDPEEDEPGLCANFEGGEYVALYNAELSEFIVAKTITSFLEEQKEKDLLVDSAKAWNYAYSECTGTEEERRTSKMSAFQKTKKALRFLDRR